MVILNPYLRFPGNCRQAMEFYKDCLGGDLNIMTVGDSPMAAQMPPEAKNMVMHSLLQKEGMVLMASDMMVPGEIIKGNVISLCINGTDKEEIEKYFSKLSKGGKKINPLKEQFFGLYGDFTDKFGVDWIFQADTSKLQQR